ncbi:MAG TPA: histidine--tRNA ligase [Dehalococcoidia bacterium]|nr:histidine--tRNA ligase [Dehalococcoidia bacterium]
MPEQFRAPRGAADILPDDQPFWRWLRDTAVRVAESYGYAEIQTPVFERAGVFIRQEAHGTDVVDKEIYVFEDRGGDELALRPEGTAAVCRAYLEHGMGSLPQPVRLFYISNFFRYDRPQAGRYRMFHQFGIEAIGDGDPSIDAEALDLLRTYYETLGLTRYRLLLNSIGDGVCRPGYLVKLRAYYADKLDKICGDCRRRYELNPLRMLDCKNEPCQPFKPNAPKISDNLCEPCAEHFAAVRSMLDELGIAYTLEPTLVRGLDYYTRTTFEFEPADSGSQQSAIGAGGRYDGLIEQLGGKPTPGIGFGAGLERIMLNLKRLELGPTPPSPPDAYIAVADASAQARALLLAHDLRAAGLTVINGAGGRSLRAQLRHANALAARNALVLGAEELATESVSLRDLTTSEQERVPMADVAVRLRGP